VITAGSTSGGGRQQGAIGRHDVFISYSRIDRDFVISLNDALQRRERDAWVDWEGIPPTAEWMAEIESAIESADSFVLVMSPASMSSRVCSEEVSHALALNKRIIPVVRQESDPDLIPGPIAALNWIFFRAQDDFETALETLIDTLDTDLDWVRAHTRLLVRAREWEGRGRDKSLLVRGSELQSAERWLTQQNAEKKPAPSPLHTQYILASRSAATVRQRGTVSAALLAVMISSGLAFLAWDQRNEAIKEREVAQQRERVSVSRELAASSTSELSVDPEVSLVLAVRAVSVAPTQEAEYALTQALVASHERAVLSPTSDAVSEAILSPDGRLALITTYPGPI
jgi:TIR domain